MRTHTVPGIRSSKVRDGSDPLVMVTAYDAPGARQAHAAGVEMILVGDSLAMVVLGYDDTLQVTVDDIAHHTGAVHRGLRASTAEGPAPLVVADLPWMSYHTGPAEAVHNAAILVRAGDVAAVHRVYITPGGWDLSSPGESGDDKVDVLDEVEHWCFPCRSQYPHQPVDA